MVRIQFELNRGYALLAMVLALFVADSSFADPSHRELKHLERSFWVHASLAGQAQQGYLGTNFLSASAPTEIQIRNAARLLTEDYAANRLYLIYHHEIPIMDAERVFQIWREACPAEIDLVPAILLRAYDTAQTEIFSPREIRLLSAFLKSEINPARCAVFDLQPQRAQGPCLKILAEEFNGGLFRLGLAPGEPLETPFSAGVLSVSSALFQGNSDDEWKQSGFGLETLRKWVAARNEQKLPIAWSLPVAASQREGVGFERENVETNSPVPVGRNALAAEEVLQRSRPACFSGISCDLRALQANSQALTHDGSGYSFYEMLKRGQVYVGYYARPFYEIVKIYGALRAGNAPDSLPPVGR